MAVTLTIPAPDSGVAPAEDLGSGDCRGNQEQDRCGSAARSRHDDAAAGRFDAATETPTEFHHYTSEASGHSLLTERSGLTIWRTRSRFPHRTSNEDGDPAGANRLALGHVLGKTT